MQEKHNFNHYNVYFGSQVTSWDLQMYGLNVWASRPDDISAGAVLFSLTKTKTKMVKNEKITNLLTKTKTTSA